MNPRATGVGAAAWAGRAGGGGGGGPTSEGGGESLTAVFAAELARRQAADAAAAEAEAARVFDGAALLALVQAKYGRSYDFSLVQRQYMGKTFVALNVMWKYREQASWSYSEEQFDARLNYIASAIVAWGAVTTVQTGLAATKERPRVGKAVSIFLDVPPERATEWLAG
ncbi:MAG: hypothetical protein J3K34DRAFT_456374 [Monoraphidium minutum]|nr:MAG: hypothetical protein J3K34DRAFT_456374 [Monoraphidium minutum]